MIEDDGCDYTIHYGRNGKIGPMKRGRAARTLAEMDRNGMTATQVRVAYNMTAVGIAQLRTDGESVHGIAPLVTTPPSLGDHHYPVPGDDE